MDKNSFAKKLESRIFDINIDYPNVTNLCYEAERFNIGSIQVFPCMVEMCRQTLKDDTEVKINALVSYPHGGFTPEQKAFEAANAVSKGATGVEAVINTREVKSHYYDYAYNEMKAVKDAVGENIEVKFVIEIEFLTDEEVEGVCKAACMTGIDYITTSTGLYNTLDKNKNDVPLVTTVKEIQLLKKFLKGEVKIQAQGYIDSIELARELIKAGADSVATKKAKEMLLAFEMSEGV